MFVPVQRPEETPSGALSALRLSLNTPVVAIDPLPVGPAAAAIALHAPGSRPQVVIALRATRGEERLFFAEDAHSGDLALLLDAALSFAESMGFLFDDDEVETRGDAGPVEAALIWREFAGLPEPPELTPVPPPPPAAPEPERGAAPTLLTKFRRQVADGRPARAAGADPRLRLLCRF